MLSDLISLLNSNLGSEIIGSLLISLILTNYLSNKNEQKKKIKIKLKLIDELNIELRLNKEKLDYFHKITPKNKEDYILYNTSLSTIISPAFIIDTNPELTTGLAHLNNMIILYNDLLLKQNYNELLRIVYKIQNETIFSI